MNPFRNNRLPPFCLALCLLTACATPQERCIQRETRDLRVVEGLISETEANLRRGYALEDVTIIIPQWRTCRDVVKTPAGETQIMSRMCLEDEAQTTTRPKAIDLEDEAKKLRSLESKRKELLSLASRARERCVAEFPEKPDQ